MLRRAVSAPRAFVAVARKFYHQFGPERGEAAALLGGEGLPAIETHQGGIGAEHGVVGQAEASGTAEHLPLPLLISPEKQAHL